MNSASLRLGQHRPRAAPWASPRFAAAATGGAPLPSGGQAPNGSFLRVGKR